MNDNIDLSPWLEGCRPQGRGGTMQKIILSAPGSKEAIAKGCTCPVWDNYHGRGYGGDWRTYGWVINADCPLHGKSVDEEFQCQYSQ